MIFIFLIAALAGFIGNSSVSVPTIIIAWSLLIALRLRFFYTENPANWPTSLTAGFRFVAPPAVLGWLFSAIVQLALQYIPLGN